MQKKKKKSLTDLSFIFSYSYGNFFFIYWIFKARSIVDVAFAEVQTDFFVLTSDDIEHIEMKRIQAATILQARVRGFITRKHVATQQDLQKKYQESINMIEEALNANADQLVKKTDKKLSALESVLRTRLARANKPFASYFLPLSDPRLAPIVQWESQLGIDSAGLTRVVQSLHFIRQEGVAPKLKIAISSLSSSHTATGVNIAKTVLLHPISTKVADAIDPSGSSEATLRQVRGETKTNFDDFSALETRRNVNGVHIHVRVITRAVDSTISLLSQASHSNSVDKAQETYNETKGKQPFRALLGPLSSSQVGVSIFERATSPSERDNDKDFGMFPCLLVRIFEIGPYTVIPSLKTPNHISQHGKIVPIRRKSQMPWKSVTGLEESWGVLNTHQQSPHGSETHTRYGSRESATVLDSESIWDHHRSQSAASGRSRSHSRSYSRPRTRSESPTLAPTPTKNFGLWGCFPRNAMPKISQVALSTWIHRKQSMKTADLGDIAEGDGTREIVGHEGQLISDEFSKSALVSLLQDVEGEDVCGCGALFKTHEALEAHKQAWKNKRELFRVLISLMDRLCNLEEVISTNQPDFSTPATSAIPVTPSTQKVKFLESGTQEKVDAIVQTDGVRIKRSRPIRKGTLPIENEILLTESVEDSCATNEASEINEINQSNELIESSESDLSDKEETMPDVWLSRHKEKVAIAEQERQKAKLSSKSEDKQVLPTGQTPTVKKKKLGFKEILQRYAYQERKLDHRREIRVSLRCMFSLIIRDSMQSYIKQLDTIYIALSCWIFCKKKFHII